MVTDSSSSLTSSKEEHLPLSDSELDRLANVANNAVDAAGEIILRQYLARGNVFKVSDANVPSRTNIAADAEKAMIAVILKSLPGHAVCGKQSGWTNCSGTTMPYEHLEQAYVDITDPEYNKEAKYAYNRLAYKVGETFFNGNCIAYSELAAGMLQVVVDCAVSPHGLLGLVPIVEGAGGIITDWQGNQISWQPSPVSSVPPHP
ncbi:hypothetical protein BC332_12728 [Capsicum chinense]|nr:hypothetical protein BC332_12728 [Capsicum chinense]